MGRWSIDNPPPDEPAPSAPTPEGVPRILVTPEPTGGRFRLDAPAAPVNDPWANFNKPSGELKQTDLSPTEWARWKVLGGASAIGMTPSNAQHAADAVMGIGTSLTPMGAVLSAADLQYHVPKIFAGERKFANAGAAALDLAGMFLGQGGRRAAAMIPAHEAPAWTRFDPSGRPYPPQVVAGTPHEQMGWVTPSQAELYGKGQTPFNVSAQSINQGGAPWPRGQIPQGSAQQGYETLARSPVRFDPLAGNDIATLATQHIQHPNIGGFDRYKAPDVHNELESFATSMGQRGTPVTPMDFELLRRRLRGMSDAPGSNTANRPAGLAAADMLETYQLHPPANRIVAGTPADMAADRATLTQARGDTRGGITSGTVEEMIDRANTRAGATYSGGNLENATRQNMAALTTSTGVQKIPGANMAEREAIWEASQGTPWQNVERATGKLLGGGGGMHGANVMGATGGGTTAALVAAGVPWPLALPIGGAVGLGTRQVGKMFNRSAAEKAVQAAEDAATGIRQRTPEYERRLAASGPPVEMPSFRDRLTMSLMPGMRETGTEWVNEFFTPYENR